MGVTAVVDGRHRDTSATFIVGRVDEPTVRWSRAREATLRGIEAVEPGGRRS
ncbi:MAG: hypothetical protein ACFCVK_06915 [Acidimicrobiales bacterium]